MCLDGDNAGHVTEYINAQLRSLHKIAVECFSHYHESSEHGGENLATLPGYDFTLAGFYHQQESTLSSTKFHARFGAPVVDFICNHDALLHLEVYEATLLTARKAPNASSSPYGLYNKSKTPYVLHLSNRPPESSIQLCPVLALQKLLMKVSQWLALSPSVSLSSSSISRVKQTSSVMAFTTSTL